jgi:Arc/MetJ-type ribon-helix-helix transcriptional regulator
MLNRGERESMSEQNRASKTMSVVLPLAQRAWLLRQAAESAVKTGERASVSEVVRALVERAQHGDGRPAA